MDIEKILSKMTIKDKVYQLVQPYFVVNHKPGEYGTGLSEMKEKLESECIGSVILASDCFAGNNEQEKVNIPALNEIQKQAMDKYGIPLLFGRDIIHGFDVTLPVPLALSATFNPELVKKGFQNVAKETKNAGVNWTFTPMLDVSRDPRWGRCIESPGEDPYVGEKMAEAMVKGFQGEDENSIFVATCAKHYVGYGASEGGRDYHRTEISDYSLRNYYLRAFKSAVDSGCASVMASFNEISGQPTSSSKYLLTDVLRGEFGFDGFVVSDWGSVCQLVNQGVAKDKTEAGIMAINAGLDIDMCDGCYEAGLEMAVENGLVSMETLDNAVRRVLKVKDKLGLFENPYVQAQEFDIEQHRKTARELASESIVLLKNDNNALPLKETANVTVAGEYLSDTRNILGSWVPNYDLNESVTVFRGIKNACENAEISEIKTEKFSLFELKDTIVLVIGEHWSLTGESSSVATIELEEYQIELIKKARKLCKKLVGVFLYARPMALQNVIDMFDAAIYAWHGGSQMGNAVADVLFGKVSPSGRLTMTMPRVTGQIPLFYNTPPSGRDCNGYYGDKVIVNYSDCSGTPLFPFGFGLSYTEFEYSDIKLDIREIALGDLIAGKKFQASVKVKNIGEVDSKTVVQCYVRDCYSSMTRPIKELKGFEKPMFKSGEEKEIVFDIGYEELGFYGADGKYRVEPGEFKIYIGKDCLCEEYVTIIVG